MRYEMRELLGIVKELTDKYTEKASSSISVEVAQQLMGGVIYCLKESEHKSSEGEAYGLVAEEPKLCAKESYKKGYLLVTEKIIKANELYLKIMENFQSFENQAYEDTVKKGICEFFRFYNPKLSPQDSIITMDYPVLENLQEKSGIDAIYCYLQCIQSEQVFLAGFTQEYIRESLLNYHFGYGELLINICGIVLQNILFMAWEQKFPKEYITVKKQEEICTSLEKLLWELIESRYDGNRQLYDYLSKALPDIASMYACTKDNDQPI